MRLADRATPPLLIVLPLATAEPATIPPRTEALLPPAGWAAPRRTLILAATPRSGSNWFAGLCAATGVMGKPYEWFGWWETRGRRDGTIAGAHRAASDGMTANGVAGIKLFPFYLEVVLRHVRLSNWFPDAVWVHLVRRDVLGQAISLWRAMDNTSWFDVGAREIPVPLPSWGHAKAGEAPRYDPAEIARHLDEIVEYEADWRRFFARTGITPVPLVYEDVMADPAGALRMVAEALGVALPADAPVWPTPFTMQRDAHTELIRARFQADLGHPDTPFTALRSFGRKSRMPAAADPAAPPDRGVARVLQLLRRRA